MNRILPDINELQSALALPQDVVIISHRNPDGDALGSSLAWALLLQKFHHSVTVVMPSEYPLAFNWLPEVNKIKIYDIEPESCIEVIHKASMICCLDFNGLDRIDKLGNELAKVKENKTLLMVDHHLDPEPFADIMYSDSSASSTCEMIFKLTQMCGWESSIDERIAQCLYTGIITDTGSFHHATSPELFKVCASLAEYDIDEQAIHDNIFQNQTEKQMRLLGHCLVNRMEIISELRTGIITLSKKDYEEFEIERGDTEGIVNYLLMIKKVSVAAFITEQPTIIKFSFRSKGNISVQELARDNFNGGGHKNAAGGSMYASLEHAVDKFKHVVPFYIGSLKSFKL